MWTMGMTQGWHRRLGDNTGGLGMIQETREQRGNGMGMTWTRKFS